MLLAACSVATSPLTTSREPAGHFKPGIVEIVTQAGVRFSFDVELADTAEARALGLRNRSSLAPEAGLVLLHPAPVDAELWMKDTSIPLTAAWFDDTGRIVWIENLQPCEADPCPRYGSPVPAVGILEVNRGALESRGIAIGDSLRLQEP